MYKIFLKANYYWKFIMLYYLKCYKIILNQPKFKIITNEANNKNVIILQSSTKTNR